MMEAAFKGFTALPAPGQTSRTWRDVLDVGKFGGNDQQLSAAKSNYRVLASANHPDKGGDANKMAEINLAWQQAQQELQ
jgi:hypothetical protein